MGPAASWRLPKQTPGQADAGQGRRGAELLAREVDGLDGLIAPELRDVEWVAIEAAGTNVGKVSGR